VINGRALALLAALLAAAIYWHAHRPVTHSPGVLAPDIPLQEPLRDNVSVLRKGDVSIKPLATFSITARVLSRADYGWDTESAISPIDLALGWGRMSDSAVLQNVSVSQSSRFYFWTVRAFPIPEREMIESSANMHLVAADGGVERTMKETKAGDVVSFSGFLIRAQWPDGRIWTSSLTRSDTGAGACELVWVERFEIQPRR
jgi:hypothetical protein